MEILKNARKLKDSQKFKKIGLSYDKTPKEQEEYRRLKIKLDEKNKESGSGADYTIFRGNIVLKTEVQNIIRRAKEALAGLLSILLGETQKEKRRTAMPKGGPLGIE